MYTTEIFIAYKIDRYLRLDYIIKRSGNFVHITASIMASATPAASGRGPNATVADSLVLIESYKFVSYL
jgi:hypothetical protein